jgi:hypothetical protein
VAAFIFVRSNRSASIGDLPLSKLRRYIDTIGGKLSPVVEFPDREAVTLGGIGDLDDTNTVSKRARAGTAKRIA